MTWLLRVLAYSTLFVIPCRLASGVYQHLLGRLSEAIVAGMGHPFVIRNSEVFAPVDLGLFAALCLATTVVPWRRRGRALLTGAVLLVGLEIVQVLLGNYLHPSNRPALAGHEIAKAWLRQALQVTFWAGPPLVWLVLLGHRQWSDTLTHMTAVGSSRHLRRGAPLEDPKAAHR